MRLTMPRIDPIELKIFITMAFTTTALDMDAFIRFIAPLLSAFIWWLIKPTFDEYRAERKKKKEDNEAEN